MKTYIFLNCGVSSKSFYKEHFDNSRSEGDKVLCANGGYNVARSLGIHVDFIIGDLDSLKNKGLLEDVKISRFPAEKDYSDFELALKEALELKPDRIVVYGALGGRLDHELVNLLLLSEIRVPTEFIEEKIEAFNVVGELHLRERRGLTCTLVALGGPVFIEETSGLRYPLFHETLLPSSRGLSNIIVEDEMRVTLLEGNLVVLVLRGG